MLAGSVRGEWRTSNWSCECRALASNAGFHEIFQRRGYGPGCDLRTGPSQLGAPHGARWQIEHFLGYFAVTSIVCLAWPRPFVVGGVLMAGAALLEGVQGLTPDRVPNLQAAFLSAGGVLAAAVLAELLVRARRWWSPASARP
jgi:hypothetical protein